MLYVLFREIITAGVIKGSKYIIYEAIPKSLSSEFTKPKRTVQKEEKKNKEEENIVAFDLNKVNPKKFIVQNPVLQLELLVSCFLNHFQQVVVHPIYLENQGAQKHALIHLIIQ